MRVLLNKNALLQLYLLCHVRDNLFDFRFQPNCHGNVISFFVQWTATTESNDFL